MSPLPERIVDGSPLPKPARFLRVAAGLVVLSLTSAALTTVSLDHGGDSIIWLANGLMIGVLVTSSRSQWPVFLLLSFLVDVVCNLWLHNPVPDGLLAATCNALEIFVGASMMRRAVAPDPDLTQGRQLKSVLLGMVVASGLASGLVSLILSSTSHVPFFPMVQVWFAADLLGIATVTPLYLSFHHGRHFSRRPALEVLLIFALLTVCSVVIFGLFRLPMLWLVLLSLVLIGARLGFTGASLGLLVVALIGGFYTVVGEGPLATVDSLSMRQKILLFQAFVGVTMLTLYIAEVLRARSTRVQLQLQASEMRFRLLAEASRDVIVLADLDGSQRYVSPAMTELLGWSPEESAGLSYAETVHPDDEHLFRRLLEDCRSGSDLSPSLSYRGRKKDGSYLWLEANVRLFCDEQTGKPTGFVYVLRDVSVRKAAEEELQQAYLMAQQQALLDGLTGVANRRLLDETLQQEWARAMRERTPLSVLLIDVDWFKKYNDSYGHMAGDECLQQIARAIQQVLKRPQDLLARYGGEEFAAVLPNTPSRGAELISERIRQVVEESGIPHEASSYGVTTVSVGCATVVPMLDKDPSLLLKSADNALYAAKASGRNRLQVADVVEEMNWSGPLS